VIAGLLFLVSAQDPLALRADTLSLRHDALHYEARVELPAAGNRIRMEVRARWRIASTEPVRLDLDTVFKVSRAEVGGRPVTPQRRGFALLLAHDRRPGDTVWTLVAYEGVPQDGLVIRGEGTARTVFADNWPDRARGWLATQNHPGDKATVSWSIAAPLGLGVVANGARTGVDSSGPIATWRFQMDQPIPVHTMVVGAARFATAEVGRAGCPARCIPVSVMSFLPDSAFAVDGPFRRAHQMVDFMAERFGPYPYAELRHVQSSTIFGGMENSTAIFYDQRAWSAGRLGEGIVAHETAHQWFGDAVSQSDWHHLWLSEGFATYGAALWAEHTAGVEGLRGAMRQAAARVRSAEARARPILDPAESRLMSLLNANNYQKGSWVLHALRGLLGDSAFFDGLRTFASRYRHGNALSRDFAQVMAEVSGRDLDWYFLQSLTQPGYPVLEVWTRPVGDSVTVEITQVQDPAWGIYRIPGLVLELDGRRVTVDLDAPRVSRSFPRTGGGSPAVTVDPDGWWLLEVRTPFGREP